MTIENAEFAVQRDGTLFSCKGSELKDKLADGDLITVQRGGITSTWKVEDASLPDTSLPWEGATALYHVILPDASTTLKVKHYEKIYDRNTGDLLAENPNSTLESEHTISGPAEIVITYENAVSPTTKDGLQFNATGNFSFGELTDTSNVTTFRGLFHGCTGFNGSLQLFDTGNVTNMSYMFYRCNSFTGDLSHFNMSKVTETMYMFRNASKFNSPVDMWDMSSLEKPNEMFLGAVRMNQDLSGWCVPNVSSGTGDVFGLTIMEYTDEYHPVWGTCPGGEG